MFFYIKRVFKNFFNFTTPASRVEFWIFSLFFFFFLGGVLGLKWLVSAQSVLHTILTVLSWVLILFLLIGSFAIYSRRAYDLGYTLKEAMGIPLFIIKVWIEEGNSAALPTEEDISDKKNFKY